MREYEFPRQAEEYIFWAKGVVEATPSFDEELIDRYKIRWFEVAKQREPRDGYTPERIVVFSPHPDDAEFAAAVTLANHVFDGDHVSVLLFTCGSAGRYSRGFTEKTLPGVRLAEAIKSAKIMGIQRIGLIILPDGTFGFPEWFFTSSDIQSRRLGIQIGRLLNPHILYSPHFDPEIDTHPDHQAVGKIAFWAVNWGTEGDFYRDTFAGEAEVLRQWRMYAIWEGKNKLPIHHRTVYDPKGPFAEMKKRALSTHQSQRGDIYARGALGGDASQGVMAYVGDDRDVNAEVFAVWKPPAVTEAC